MQKVTNWINLQYGSDQNKSDKGDCSLRVQQELFSKQLSMLYIQGSLDIVFEVP